jgi:uncharacterized protein (DUF1499 family)
MIHDEKKKCKVTSSQHSDQNLPSFEIAIYLSLTTSIEIVKPDCDRKGKIKSMKKLLPLFLISLAVFMSCSGRRPANLGVTDGRLASCPHSPNCVSTQSGDESHRIEPFSYTTSQAEAQEKLSKILRSMKRANIVSIEDNYIYVECKSAIFQFVDDVEFYFDDAHKTIHFRSSSRLGYSDLGVNRRRMETIRQKFLGN